MASRRIEDLYGPAQPTFRKLIEEAQKLMPGWTAFITDGLRTNEDQAQLYAEGRGSFLYNGKTYFARGSKIVTNAKPTYSFHEYGLAVDIAWQKDGQLSYEKLDQLGPKGRALGFKWGADFGDRPHFEYSGGLTIGQVRAGARPKFDVPTPPSNNADTMACSPEELAQEGFKVAFKAVLGINPEAGDVNAWKASGKTGSRYVREAWVIPRSQELEAVIAAKNKEIEKLNLSLANVDSLAQQKINKIKEIVK